MQLLTQKIQQTTLHDQFIFMRLYFCSSRKIINWWKWRCPFLYYMHIFFSTISIDCKKSFLHINQYWWSCEYGLQKMSRTTVYFIEDIYSFLMLHVFFMDVFIVFFCLHAKSKSYVWYLHDVQCTFVLLVKLELW